MEYSAIAFFLVCILKLSPTLAPGAGAILGTVVVMLLFPLILLFQALIALKDDFPARAISGRLRASIILVCVVQFVCCIGLGALGTDAILVELPRESRLPGNDLPMLSIYLAAGSILAAALWNIAAAIVLWRTTGMIRRNFKGRLWESYEST